MEEREDKNAEKKKRELFNGQHQNETKLEHKPGRPIWQHAHMTQNKLLFRFGWLEVFSGNSLYSFKEPLVQNHQSPIFKDKTCNM